MAATPSTIMHADMDAFYAAVEQRDHPELRDKPVIVGGRSNRGVVMTASYEARVYGVHSAMPTVQARRLCPHGIFVPGRMSTYAAIAKQIRRLFEEITPLVEPLSLDEAFLDISGSLRLLGEPRAIGARLKDRVREVTGLTVSVGIGPTKMVAKIASTACKPDGLLEVRPGDVDSFLRPLPVSQLWGVGPVTHEALAGLGIVTVGDLADADPAALERSVGHFGLALRELARGRDARLVDSSGHRKSYGEESTFEHDLRDGEVVRDAIVEHAQTVARRLRADGSRGRTVTLKIKLAQRLRPGKYPILTRSTSLKPATDDTTTIARTALALWDAVQAGKTVRLIGVSVSGIERAATAQLPLFPPAELQRRAALNRALDAITDRFGNDAIGRGGTRRRDRHPTRTDPQ